jgi:hypothetical protein
MCRRLCFISCLPSRWVRWAFLPTATASRASGTTARTAIFAVLIALVLTSILDLDQPRRSLIRVGEESMLRLQTTLEQNTP